MSISGRLRPSVQALNALVFLYQQVLGKELGSFADTVRAKRPIRLPVVLTKEETRRLLVAMEGTWALMARMLYGTGMRLMEGVRLRVKDIDFAASHILVRDGKGQKDYLAFGEICELAWRR